MTFSESQLETWSHQGAIAGSAETYRVIKNALDSRNAGYSNESYTIFLQGSYGNDTNIYAESDVDIVIRCDSTYFAQISELNTSQQELYESDRIPPTYSYSQYKQHVIAALEQAFGSDVEIGKKAIKIRPRGNRRSADVIPAFEHRHYYGYDARNAPRYHSGITFFTSASEQVNNFPQQHSANLTSMHQATYHRLKPLVRIFKNIRSRMVDDGAIAKHVAPSYFLEGMIYNVPNNLIIGSKVNQVASVLNWLNSHPNISDLVCANGIHWLVRDWHSTSWPLAHFQTYLRSTIEYWNNAR